MFHISNIPKETQKILDSCALCEHRRQQACDVCDLKPANDPWWPEVKEVKRINIASGEDSLCLA